MNGFEMLLLVLFLGLVALLVHDLRRGRFGPPPRTRRLWSESGHPAEPYRQLVVPGSSRAFWLF